MNAIERLKEYKQKLIQENIEREKREREVRLEKAQQIFADFKQNLPEELSDLFVFGEVRSDDNWANVDITVDQVKFLLSYNYKTKIYVAKFEELKTWCSWTSEQSFEELVDYILFVAENKTPNAQYTRR